MQDQWYSFNMFDAQAWYARDVILGRVQLPDQAAMIADSRQWHEREQTLETNQQMFEYQGAYIQHLVDATDYPNFDIAAVNETFLHWKHDKAEKHHGLSRQVLSLVDDRHPVTAAPHPLAACTGRLDGGVPCRAANVHHVGRLTGRFS
nr:hypothetical protein GCM10020185_85740 [Pseudomonas brassicacearum subsp. brassicacearum]